MVMAVLGGTAILQSMALTIASTNPGLAYALWPVDGRITAAWAQELAETDPPTAAQLARKALRQDPAAVTAAAVLGSLPAAKDETASARRAFVFAERLSRRDFPTQVWMIEDTVGRGDVVGALRHYDIALRTTPTAPSLLFPVLAAAIARPPVRVALVDRLRQGTSWTPRFVAFVADQGSDLPAAVTLFSDLQRAHLTIDADVRATLIARLIGNGLPDQAWAYYALLHPGTDRRRSRDPAFALATVPSLFDWVPVDSAGIAASIQQSSVSGVVDVSAPAGVQGTALQQLQMLPPGTYRLTGHGSGIDQPAANRPYWMLTCHDGRVLGRIDVPSSDQNHGTFAGSFVVPADCPVQNLAFVIRPVDAVAGVSVQIDRTNLLPIPTR